jgi:hypothetical protein
MDETLKEQLDGLQASARELTTQLNKSGAVLPGRILGRTIAGLEKIETALGKLRDSVLKALGDGKAKQ